MHVLISTLVLIQGGPSTDLWGLLCGPLSLLVLCPVVSSCLVFLVSQLDFLNSGSQLGSAWVPSAYGAGWSSPGSVVGDCRAQPVCFLSLTDHYPSLPHVQCFEHYCSMFNCSAVLSVVLTVSERKANLASVILCWLEAEVLIFLWMSLLCQLCFAIPMMDLLTVPSEC